MRSPQATILETPQPKGGKLSSATATLLDSVMDRWLTQLHAFTSPRRQRQHGPVSPDERVP